MPLSSTLASAITKRLPKTISPRTHSILDYAIAAAFFAAGAAFWKRNRKAALAAFVNGGALTSLALLTDYPGGIAKAISYRNHGKIDLGLPALTAGLPNFMGFADERESRFFSVMAVAGATAAGITKFEAPETIEEIAV